MTTPAGRPTTPPGPPPPRAGGGGLRLGRVFGVPVHLSPSWFLIAAFVTVGYAPVVRAEVPDLGDAAYVVSFTFAVLLAVSVLAHELGHCVVSLAFGLRVRRLTVYLLGGATEIEGEPDTPWRETAVAAVGPAVSLLVSGAAFLLLTLAERGTVAHVLLFELGVVNAIVGGFNLLPGLPLDGGRVLRAGVWAVSGDRVTGLTAAAWAGRVLAVCVLLGATAASSVLGERFALGNAVLAVLVAGFLWVGASQSLLRARVLRRLPGVSVRRLLRPILSVAADLPLAEAIRQAREQGARGIVVVDSYGRPSGVVEEAAVVAVPEHRRPWLAVGDLARGLAGAPTLSTALAGQPLLDVLRERPASEYVVVDDAGQPVGVLSARDVAAVLAAA